MRRSKVQPIGEVLKQYIKALRIQGKLREVGLVKYWEEVMGKNVSNATKNIYIRNRILFVNLHSPIVRNELFMMRDAIVIALNEKMGESVIDSVILR